IEYHDIGGTEILIALTPLYNAIAVIICTIIGYPQLYFEDRTIIGDQRITGIGNARLISSSREAVHEVSSRRTIIKAARIEICSPDRHLTLMRHNNRAQAVYANRCRCLAVINPDQIFL